MRGIFIMAFSRVFRRSAFRSHASSAAVAFALLAAAMPGGASAQSQDVGDPVADPDLPAQLPTDVEPSAGIGPESPPTAEAAFMYPDFAPITVTGSNIRGIGISAGSPLTIIGRPEIETSGFATTQQILQLLPQNFGGGATFTGHSGLLDLTISNPTIQVTGAGTATFGAVIAQILVLDIVF